MRAFCNRREPGRLALTVDDTRLVSLADEDDDALHRQVHVEVANLGDEGIGAVLDRALNRDAAVAGQRCGELRLGGTQRHLQRAQNFLHRKTTGSLMAS